MNLCSLQDWTDEQIHEILDRAELYAANPRGHESVLAGQIVCAAFFEPSTRTRLSFEAAAHRLGAQVIGFSEAGSTSGAKGETLEDTVRVLAGYADGIVIRHPEIGAATRASEAADVPIINAGDGAGEHPTQTLLDLFTIRQQLGRLDGISVAVVGDLRYGRTVHSLVPALQRFGATVTQVPAPGLELPDATIPNASLLDAAANSDVLYVTRVQKERFSSDADYQAARGSLVVNADLLKQSNAIVMHPLPRVDELAIDVDALPAAKYFDQAHNGVPVRMAVLATLLENSK